MFYLRTFHLKLKSVDFSSSYFPQNEAISAGLPVFV